MSGQFPQVDPEGLLEYSVVFTDRSLNHMSPLFQQVMCDLSDMLKQVYHAYTVAVVPGGGSFGMEAVARQFAHGQKCLIVRNGWFSYRWSQIFEMGNIPSEEIVLRARPLTEHDQSPWAPVPIEELEATIARSKPDLVFAAHVETASGIMLPDDYIKRLGNAVHRTGGLFVLDCVASGAMWVDMVECGVDVLISAPQKGWSSSPCAALVMFSEAANTRLQETISSSFAADLGKWRDIMIAYENGGHAYHATLPTDALLRLRDSMQEAIATGLDELKKRQWQLGQGVRALLAEHNFASVAASDFAAPGVVVSYTNDDNIRSGKAFTECGLQVAAGVPLMCDEPESFKTFRVGLFGLDKLNDVNGAIQRFSAALEQISGV